MNADRNYRIYFYKNNINNKIYIGQTKNTLNRRSSGNFCSYKNCVYFYNAILNYGIENFTSDVILDNLTSKEADYWEKYFIKELDTTNPVKGYNLKTGGKSKFTLSDSIRQKLSYSHKHSKVFQDKMHSKEYSENMKKTLIKRYKEHPEIAEKIGKAHRGKKRPLETGKKISIAKLGHEVPDLQRIKYARKTSKNFYNLENLLTKEKYNNLSRYEVFKIVKIPHIDLYASGQRGKIKYIYGNFKVTFSK